ncbi:MAG: S-layer homology domain-containing protein [Solibacillus sp.]
MKKLFKKITVLSVAATMAFTTLPKNAFAVAYDPETTYKTLEVRFWEDEKPPIGFYINSSSRYILETVTKPEMGSTYGEWSVMDLLRGMYTGYDYINHIPKNYFDDYIERIEDYVSDREGVLDRSKSTEWSRLILALSALGYDIRDVVGHDFVAKLSESFPFSYKQGINGPIWEIISLNTGEYDLYPDENNPDVNTFGKMIDYILDKEIAATGGWALSGNLPDPDITAMALQAFAPYYIDQARYENTGAIASFEDFAKAVERGLLALDALQLESGGFDSWGTVNAESTVQVIVALTALDIDPLDDSIKLPYVGQTIDFLTEGDYEDGVYTNNMIDALLTFWAPGSGSSPEIGGFKHVTAGFDGGGGSGTTVNAMATDQAVYGLIAYDRFLENENPLYDMTDMINGEYKNMKADEYDIEFIGADGKTIEEDEASPYALIKLPVEDNVVSWNTKEDGTGTKYLPAEKLVMPEEDIELYAQYDETQNVQGIVEAINLIAALPTTDSLKRDHANQVTQARAAYEKLTAEERDQVTNLSTLVTIEGKLNQLIAQYDEDLKVTNLIQTIESLASVNPITIDYEIAIHNARRDYNALSAAQRLTITNLAKLETMEAKIAILLEEAKKADKEAIEEAVKNPTNTSSSSGGGGGGGGGTSKAVKEVNTLISKLPSVENITLNDLEAVRKARVYFNELKENEQKTVSALYRDKLTALEAKLKELNVGALEREDFEDEANSTTYHEMTIKKDVLAIESNKTAGVFKVDIPADVFSSTKQENLKTLEITDPRGVQATFNLAELTKQLDTISGFKTVNVEISQYNFNTGLFDVKVKAIDAKDTAHTIVMDKSYMKIKIPLKFFVDGKALNEKVLLKSNGDSVSAISHVMTDTHVTLNLKQDGTFKFAEPNVVFNDVDKLSTKTEVLYLANRQIIKGTDVGVFNPHAEITRAQFARMISRALGLVPSSAAVPFTDVVGKDYEKDVQALFEAGITTGKTATTFDPQGKVTRQQAALIMARILRYAEVDTQSITMNTNFKDANKMSKEVLNDVGLLNSLEVMTGNDNREFMPKNNLTRSHMAKILKRTLGIAELM